MVITAQPKNEIFLDVLLRQNYEEATSDKFEKLVTNPENIKNTLGEIPTKIPKVDWINSIFKLCSWYGREEI